MSINNPFDNPAFNMTSLTDAINILPNNYGRVTQLGIFKDKPVRFRQIAIEENNGVLNLLPTQTPGSNGTVGSRAKKKYDLLIFHIYHMMMWCCLKKFKALERLGLKMKRWHFHK